MAHAHFPYEASGLFVAAVVIGVLYTIAVIGWPSMRYDAAAFTGKPSSNDRRLSRLLLRLHLTISSVSHTNTPTA